jgi:hypothetical protein
MGTATVGFHSDRHVFLFARNDLYVLLKNYGLSEFVRHCVLLVKERFLLICETARAGQGAVVFRAWLSFLSAFLSMVKKRYLLRKRIKLSFGHFSHLIKTGADTL